MYVAAADVCGGSGDCGIIVVVLVLLMLILVIMLWSLFRNASGKTLFCELIVLHFFF
jgi:hypothetical protein